jgi:hypothetical protein
MALGVLGLTAFTDAIKANVSVFLALHAVSNNTVKKPEIRFFMCK